ncbi:MAG: proline racemase family protein [Lachnospiraceae bacterium]|nr:proline racemase family protein [Lachnospiraceae bacterium]
MKKISKPDISRYSNCIRVIDSHTMGEPTRIVYDGVPNIQGSTMMEKKQYLAEKFDEFRTSLMLEPRGHRDMFGAILTEPVHKEADVGVIFMDSGGYLNMCGHGSIGTASMLVDARMVEVREPYTEITLDTPSGIISTKVHVVNGEAESATIQNVPAFLYAEGLTAEIDGYGVIPYDISFGGSFFALIDAESIDLHLHVSNIEEITKLGIRLRDEINRTQKIQHPCLPITSVDLVEFYSRTRNKLADDKNCVIFGDAQADRSPCGTGTSAKMAALHAKGLLPIGQDFVYESITGTMFRGRLIGETKVGDFDAVIPQITGSAYITGFNDWIIDKQDPLWKGFLL